MRKYWWCLDTLVMASWLYDFTEVACVLWLGGFPHHKDDLNIGAPLSSLSTHSPVFFSPVSYACLATLRVDFFKRLRFQPLDVQRVCR